MLPLNDKFLRDIEQSHVTLYPLVVIDGDSDNPYYISTVKEVIKDGDNVLSFKDYNLKISNIKESIDVKNHNFKIGNVTLTLNNYEIDGTRLSDDFVSKTNKFATIYYKSQSCQTLDECPVIYRGQIRRLEHDDKSIRVTLEDLTEATLHKDVPISNLGTSNCFSKNFVNRYIPITYGYVEKAPALPYIHGTDNNSTGEKQVSIICDDVWDLTGDTRGLEIVGFGTKESVPEDTYLVEGENPLYIYKGDYFKVLENANRDIMGDFDTYTDSSQYSIDAGQNFIDLIKLYQGEYAQNPTAFNELHTIKIRFPNELKLLFSPNDEEISDNNQHFILNQMPDAGLLNPEGAYDNPGLQAGNIIQTTNSYSTFCQIPNSQPTVASINVDQECSNVHSFNGFHDDGTAYSRGIHYPSMSAGGDSTNYFYLISAWCQANATNILPSVKFIDMPTGLDMYSKLKTKLFNDGFSNSLENSITVTGGQNRIIHEFNANFDFQNQFIEACSLTGEEESQGYTYINAALNHYNVEYGVNSYYNGLNSFHPIKKNDTGQPAGQIIRYYYDNLQEIVSGRMGDNGNGAIFHYPQTIYKWICNPDSEYNLYNLDYILIGMYSPNTMPNVSSGIMTDTEGKKYLWYNIFPDEDNDNAYLFEYNERCIYRPHTEISRGWTGTSDKIGIGVKYEADWNGVGITYTPESHYYYSLNNYFAGGFGDARIGSPAEHHMAFPQSYTSGTYGGHAWFMLIEDTIPTGSVLQNFENTETDGDFPYYDEGCKTQINKNTLIPCNTLQKYRYGSSRTRHQGTMAGHDYVLPSDLNYVNLTPGIGTGVDGIAEKRLSFLFPIEPTDSSDAIITETYIHGKITCETGGSGNTYNDGDKFLVTAAATDQLTDSTDFNADIPQSGTTLLELTGDSAIIQNGGEIMWSTQASDEGTEINSQFNFDGTTYKIEDWDSPDEFDSLALTYKYKSNSETNLFQLQTNIYSIGLLQYTLFENALDGEFYVDAIGRADLPEEYVTDAEGVIRTKYTNEISPSNEKIVIENPADVIYHFLEKELQSIGTMNIDSWISARDINLSINIGFSVTKKINSKKLIEEISKNTFSYPKYDSYGNFSFGSIKSEYDSFDYEVKSKDVNSYNFKRTPIEDVITLANVKFKKDYAEDEYTKSTGYCDAYDFYGNGDLYGLLKADGTTTDGYKYSYLGLEREGNILEFESDYIRDLSSANNLRDYLFMQNCNQHTLMSLTLPLKYIHLETGDILSFDMLINKTKAYGEDYTSNDIYRNGQKIYPYFIITSITKSTKNIKIECMQLHKLTPEANFSNSKGSVSRTSELGLNAEDANLNHIVIEDATQILDFIFNKSQYFTELQKRLSDTISNGIINTYDVNVVETALGLSLSLYGESEIDVTGVGTGGGEGTGGQPLLPTGDANLDGIVNVVDVVQIVNFILNQSTGEATFTDAEFWEANVIQDNIINIVDIVAIVSLILGDN